VYDITFDRAAEEDLKAIAKSGRKLDLMKVYRFIEEVKVHPRTGAGHPKWLRHHPVETWSRKVNYGDRFVYRILEEEGEVFVIQALGHYNDR